MSTSVKHISSGMRGAPTINGTAGTLIAALDAFFTTGLGATTALSVTVSGGIATALLTSGDTFDRDAVVLIAGATPGGLNGEARVLTTSLTSITWATTAADGAATGTITIKYAPQTSWSKVYAGTNKAVYRSTHVQSAGHYLRVDDTGTTVARMRGFEAMTDVDTGTGPFPTDAQMSGGGYWHKSTVANTNASKWYIFSDDRFFLYCCAAGFAQSATHLAAPARGFGDPLALAPGGDAWGTVLSIAGSNPNAVGYGAFEQAYASSSTGMVVSPRGISGLGTSEQSDTLPLVGSTGVFSGGDTWLGPMPSAIDGKLRPSRVMLKTGSTAPVRSFAPGIWYLPHSGAAALLSAGDKLTGDGELAGRRLIVIMTSSSHSGPPGGAYLVDVTGPWR